LREIWAVSGEGSDVFRSFIFNIDKMKAYLEEGMTRKSHIQRISPNALVSLSTAARYCPGRPNASTLWRWARKGIKARSGARIRLEHRRVGGKIFVTINSLDRFFENLANADVDYFEKQSEEQSHFHKQTIYKPPSRSRRDNQIQEAEAFLRKEGL